MLLLSPTELSRNLCSDSVGHSPRFLSLGALLKLIHCCQMCQNDLAHKLDQCRPIMFVFTLTTRVFLPTRCKKPTNISSAGCSERHFRKESYRNDLVAEIPPLLQGWTFG